MRLTGSLHCASTENVDAAVEITRQQGGKKGSRWLLKALQKA
jgi:hypothetical protein